MTKWHSLAETGDDFFSTAPVKTTKVLETKVSADELWAALTADDALSSWTPGVKLTWLTPRPFGVGTRRQVTIVGAVKVREHFYRWDEGKRKSFYVAESNRPGIKRMAEDYIVESTPNGSRLTWVVAAEPVGGKLGAIFGNPGASLLIGRAVKGLGKKLAETSR